MNKGLDNELNIAIIFLITIRLQKRPTISLLAAKAQKRRKLNI